MFDRIAGRYDALNSVMTAGMHHRWRERAADRAELRPGDSALDVCCGTGDLALELARRVTPGGRVVGCDFSEPMLDLAREKASERGADGVRFEWADALQLPYDDGRFDAVTVGFGVRNLADLDRGLREMARVLRPGGRLVILEITQPRPAAALDLLLALVRPARPGSGRPRRRLRGLLLPAGIRSQLSRPAQSRRQDGRRRAGEHPLHSACRRDHRDPQRHPRRDAPLGRSAAGDGGPRCLQPLAAGAAGRGGELCCASRAPAMERRSPGTRARRLPPGASAFVRCWSCSAPGRRGRRPRCAPPPRSSSSTWRRLSTTTCSTTRRCGGGSPRSPPPPAAIARPPPATCSSPAPSRCSPRPATTAP